MKIQSNQQDAGFTIVEVMVAMVVLAIGLLGMAGMTLMVIKGGTDASRMTYGTNLASDKLEGLKDIAWANLGTAATCAPTDATATSMGCSGNTILTEPDLNQEGKTTATGTGPFPFTRRWVVCQPLTQAASDSSDQCTATARPPELACLNGEVQDKQKKIKMLIFWRDKTGRCHFLTMSTVQVNLS
jgi:type IV pilus modification protein PilV